VEQLRHKGVLLIEHHAPDVALRAGRALAERPPRRDGLVWLDETPDQVGDSTIVAPNLLMRVPVKGHDGFTAEVSEAAVRLAERGVQILNLSLGCFAQQPAFRMC
jgi:hypothetical protein